MSSEESDNAVIPGGELSSRLTQELPETERLLRAGGLKLHPTVTRVVLHGSRGLAGGCRPDSDLDLSLILDATPDEAGERLELLDAVCRMALDGWRGTVELDVAVIFDARGCGLRCFSQTQWSTNTCQEGGRDCFGLYKIQKGFHGLVEDAGVDVRRMYPCLTIWKRTSGGN